MATLLHRLVQDEAGTCMTDTRGMYGWVVAVGVTTYFMWGHRWAELIAWIDHALPPMNAYNFRP